jgi:hypothetical protein
VPEWLEWPCEEHIIVHDTSKKGSERQNYSVFTAVKARRGLLVGSRDAASAACPVTADCDFSVFSHCSGAELQPLSIYFSSTVLKYQSQSNGKNWPNQETMVDWVSLIID